MSGSEKKKKIPALSIRLTERERERLEAAAGSMTIAAYVRLKVFGGGDSTVHRKAYTRRQTSPSAELVMLGQMLGGLGGSEIARSLHDLAEAAKIGALPVTPETEREIQTACSAVEDMSRRLIEAMGVKAR